MQGTDKDLAAHITIIHHRGKVLYGKQIHQVFDPVPQEAYMDSLWCDIQQAEEGVLNNPVYVILNLCRVLAFRKQGLILSKKEGGEWFLDQQPDSPHRFLVSTALAEYQTGTPGTYDPGSAQEFATKTLQDITENPYN
jgi:streptomycin 3"-adenylyltransferase